MVDQLTQRGDPWELNQEAEHTPPWDGWAWVYLAFACASESNKPRPALGLAGAPSECELLGGFSRRLFRPNAERVSNTLAKRSFPQYVTVRRNLRTPTNSRRRLTSPPQYL
jgi:hypothetical protein